MAERRTIFLAAPRAFCAGVERALASLLALGPADVREITTTRETARFKAASIQ